MRFERLAWEQQGPYPCTVDLADWPDVDRLLTYLLEVGPIKVLSKRSSLLTVYYAEFDYKGHKFELDTPLSTPLLSATENCPLPVFEELLHHISAYPTVDLFGLGWTFQNLVRRLGA